MIKKKYIHLGSNATEPDEVKPFYYLFTGFNIFVLQIILVGYPFLRAKTKIVL